MLGGCSEKGWLRPLQHSLHRATSLLGSLDSENNLGCMQTFSDMNIPQHTVKLKRVTYSPDNGPRENVCSGGKPLQLLQETSAGVNLPTRMETAAQRGRDALSPLTRVGDGARRVELMSQPGAHHNRPESWFPQEL